MPSPGTRRRAVTSGRRRQVPYLADIKHWHEVDQGLWKDTARTIPATATDDQIASWEDLSGNGNHLTQSTAGNRPVRKNANGLRGYPSVNFTAASSHYLSGPTLNLAQPTTTFVVARCTLAGGGNKVLVGSTGGGQHSMFIQGGVSEKLGIFDGATTQSSTLGYQGDYYIFEHTAKADPDQAYVDGTQVISAASGSDTWVGLRVGANVTPANFFGGDILAVLVYGRDLTTSERQQVRSYLDRKFGILGVAGPSPDFPLFVFEDENLHNTTTFAAMLADLPNLGVNGVMFTNGHDATGESFLAIADASRTPIADGPFAELAGNGALDLTSIARRWRRHESLWGYFSLKDDPQAADATLVQGWVNQLKTLDPLRPAGTVLVGTDRVEPVATVADPLWWVEECYPCGVSGATMDFTMEGFGYGFDMASYLDQVNDQRPLNRQLMPILQCHGLAAIDLRTPTPAELRRQVAEAIAKGANGLAFFVYGTQQGWTGLDTATALRAELLDICTNRLKPAVRSALRRTTPVTAEWLVTDSCSTATVADLNSAMTSAGDRRFVVVWNPTTSTKTPDVKPSSASETLHLYNLRTGVDVVGVSQANPLSVSLTSGSFEIYETVPAAGHTGVPFAPIDEDNDVEAWWAAHPLNEAANGTFTMDSPPTVATVSTWANFVSAYNGIGATGGTILVTDAAVLTATEPLGHYKSNVHVKCANPAGKFTIKLGWAADYDEALIYMGPAEATIKPDGAYGTFNAGVAARSEPWWTYFQNPLTNVYYENVIFDGNNVIVRPVTATSLRRVMFKGCEWKNLLPSASIPDGFHWGSWTSNTRNENLYFINCRFSGSGRWCVYVDGGHGCVIKGCSSSTQYGSGDYLFLNNDDFTEDENGDGHFDLFEQRSARYVVIDDCSTDGYVYQFCQISGGDFIVSNNDIGSTYQAFGQTARGSNRWAHISTPPSSNLVYAHYFGRFISNAIGTVVDGPLVGAQGVIYMGASHCGYFNTTLANASFWQNTTFLGRIGKYTATNNVITVGPTNLVLVQNDEIGALTAPLGHVEGPNTVSGNTKAGAALT